MEVLVLDGKDYVKASKAARDLGYAADYVGQLCRNGQVDAHLIGRTWYVDQTMLSTHRVEKKRISKQKAREQAKKSIEEHRKLREKNQNNYKNIDIQYESDETELIPRSKKLSIASEKITSDRHTADDTVPAENTVLNEGETIQMSGEIHVMDVSEDAVDSDTVLLTPKFNKTVARSTKKHDVPDEFASTTAVEALKMPTTKTFLEKLDITSANVTSEKEIEPATRTEVSKEPSIKSCVLVIVAILTLVLASIASYQHFLYTEEMALTGYEIKFSFEKIIKAILSL